MRALGEVDGSLGPCIHAECYEFGADDLDGVAAAARRQRAVAHDRLATPALDLQPRCAQRCPTRGVALVARRRACAPRARPAHCSHRAAATRAPGDASSGCEP